MCIVTGLLYADGASITDKDDLLGEIQMLKQAGWHPNIVALIGACTQEGMFYPSQYTAVSRKVVGKSARDNPERYCGVVFSSLFFK